MVVIIVLLAKPALLEAVIAIVWMPVVAQVYEAVAKPCPVLGVGDQV